MLEPKIIFEDDYILVVNKPSGLVVNRAETVRKKTLQDWAEEKIKGFIKRSGIVHRLDKDTSGVMVIAKTPQAFVDLQKQFKERKVVKKYLALVHGKVEPKRGDIKMPLGRKLKERKKFSVRLGGRKAVTFYQVKNYFNLSYLARDRVSNRIKIEGWVSLLEVQPKTGRTHQIRVHLAHIGHPIVSDPIYLGRKRLKEDKKWCPRLFLHAAYLGFCHPETKKRMGFEAKLPQELVYSN